MVLSKTEGIVISITGLLDEIPLSASLNATSISSMLESKERKNATLLVRNSSALTLFFWEIE
jgi:hypothetical protein